MLLPTDDVTNSKDRHSGAVGRIPNAWGGTAVASRVDPPWLPPHDFRNCQQFWLLVHTGFAILTCVSFRRLGPEDYTSNAGSGQVTASGCCEAARNLVHVCGLSLCNMRDHRSGKAGSLVCLLSCLFQLQLQLLLQSFVVADVAYCCMTICNVCH